MDKVVKVSYLSLIVLVGFAASVSYHYVQGVLLRPTLPPEYLPVRPGRTWRRLL